jgi:hypothetical protein
VVDELFGIVNVPMGVWIDEAGLIVRPAEPAFPGRAVSDTLNAEIDMSSLPPVMAETLTEARKIRIEPERYVGALRDWVANGADSRFALAPDEAVAKSRPRPREAAEAAACFELGQHLYRQGLGDAAVPWFRAAHRLQPENWTYKRQAWSMVDRSQGHTAEYEGSWLDDVRQVGAENYYEPLDM